MYKEVLAVEIYHYLSGNSTATLDEAIEMTESPKLMSRYFSRTDIQTLERAAIRNVKKIDVQDLQATLKSYVKSLPPSADLSHALKRETCLLIKGQLLY